METTQILNAVMALREMLPVAEAILKETNPQVEAARPIVREACRQIGDLASELAPTAQRFEEYQARQRIAQFEFYIENGFSREEATLFVLDSAAALNGAIRRRLAGQHSK